MTAYRLLSTRHHWDGSVEPPSAAIPIMAADDSMAIAVAQHLPRLSFSDDADFAWIVDESGRVVGSFPMDAGRLLAPMDPDKSASR